MVELNHERVNVVKNYIANAKSKNYSDDQIKQALLKSGIDESTISNMLAQNVSVGTYDKTEALKKYISDARSRGYSDDQIKRALLKSGTDENTINTLLGASAAKKMFYKTWWFNTIVMVLLLFGILFAVFYVAEVSLDDTSLVDDSEVVDDYDSSDTDVDYLTEDEDEDDDTGAGEPSCGDGDCNIGESCVEDCGCDDDGDCGDNKECNDERECVEVSSSSSSSSSSGGSSSGGGSSSSGDSGSSDDTTTITDVSCTEDANCTSGYCDNGFYYETYVCVECIPNENQCPGTCVDYVCDNACTEDVNCTGDYLCDTGNYGDTNLCVECRVGESADCDTGFSCVDSVCEEDVVAGVGDSDACVGDSECGAGEVCNDDGVCEEYLSDELDDDVVDGDVDDDVVDDDVVDGEEIDCGDTIPSCADGLDNDADGLIDLDDSDCSTWYDYEGETEESEYNEIDCGDTIPSCADGLDNDADGLVDLDDEDCNTWYDYEGEEVVEEELVCGDTIPSCADGLDNDGDNLIDLDDRDCNTWYDYEVRDESEEDVVEEELVCGDTIPSCADGLDNDADGLVDLDDEDCNTWYDYESETEEVIVEEELVCGDTIPSCADGLDNDGDDLIDLDDFDCNTWYDYEVSEEISRYEADEDTGDDEATYEAEENTGTEAIPEAQEASEIFECNKNGDCDSGVCIENVCITCTDSDGEDYEVQGSSSGYTSSLGEVSSVVDACARGNLNEYYCSGGYLVYDSIDCQAEGYVKCLSGVCTGISDETISEEAQALMEETEVVLVPVDDSTQTVISQTFDECTNGEWVVEEECFEDTDCGRARYTCDNNVCVGSDSTCGDYSNENDCSDSGYCNWNGILCDSEDKDEDGVKAYFDCNDRDASINSQSNEDCADGLDNDCDSFVDCADTFCSSDAACSSYSCDVAICNNDLDCEAQGKNNYCNDNGCCENLCEGSTEVIGAEALSSICYSNDDCGALQECNLVSGECETVAVQIGRNVDVEKYRAAETDEGIFSKIISWFGGLFS